MKKPEKRKLGSLLYPKHSYDWNQGYNQGLEDCERFHPSEEEINKFIEQLGKKDNVGLQYLFPDDRKILAKAFSKRLGKS